MQLCKWYMCFHQLSEQKFKLLIRKSNLSLIFEDFVDLLINTANLNVEQPDEKNPQMFFRNNFKTSY